MSPLGRRSLTLASTIIKNRLSNITTKKLANQAMIDPIMLKYTLKIKV